MQDNVYERIHNVLSWKRIVAFNFFLFLVLVVPLSVRLTQIDTENRSNASEGDVVPVVTPPPSYPADDPRIERVSEFFGKKGDTVVVIGKNFGDYQWESKVYVGNTEATTIDIVRWSNNIIEVQIPESAREGKVWVVINGKQAQWEGNLLLSNVGRVVEIGLSKESTNVATLWASQAEGVKRGMLEFSYVGEPISSTILTGGEITSQIKSIDSLGNKLKVEFTFNSALTSSKQTLLRIEHAGIGSLEILRAEMYDENGKLININVEPTNIKVN
ncbi:MAG: IPT/TIG domain-containing protein [bacterium]